MQSRTLERSFAVSVRFCSGNIFSRRLSARMNIVPKAGMTIYLNVVGVLSTDMSKAFDSLYPPLLINELRAYGFSENSLTLMRSYFSNRKNRIRISQKNKTKEAIGTREVSPGIGLWAPSLERLFKTTYTSPPMKIGYSCTRMTTSCFQW